jgi:hypothetical protein
VLCNMRTRVVWLMLVASLGSRSAAAQTESSEALLKAEFVERFTRFVDWPEDVLRDGAPFRLCVLGATAIDAPLERIARDRRFKGRRPTYARLVSIDRVNDCHLLFIGPTERGRLEEILRLTHGRPILTVGDTVGYGRRGVIINLYPSGKNLRFEINIEAALESGMRFRSKLLKLARRIDGREGGRP